MPPTTVTGMAYLKRYMLDLLHYRGCLGIGENGTTDENFRPYQECTADEIKAAVEELQKEGILVRRGDRLYLRY
jgi:hypothetical protein